MWECQEKCKFENGKATLFQSLFNTMLGGCDESRTT